MLQKMLTMPSRLLLGKGIDKKFPFLVGLYKKVFILLAKNGETLVSIPLGLRLFVSTKDTGLGMFLRLKGQYEPIQTKLFLDAVKPGATVFDIGANVGYYTVLASKKVGGKGKVYAFEPDPRSVSLLRKNIRINRCGNVEIVTSALGNKNEKATLALDEANPGESSLIKRDGKTISIKTITLDSFVREKKTRKINVIKVDIEGAEIQMLEGAFNTLKKMNDMTIFIECNKKALNRISQTPQLLIWKLSSLGYRLRFIVNEFKKSKKIYSHRAFTQALEAVSYFNLVAEK